MIYVILWSLLASAILWGIIRGRRRYPPGPPTLPFIGKPNIHKQNKAVAYAELAKKYGPVVYAPEFGKDIVILNTLTVARALLNDRSNTYSNRPTSLLEFIGLDWMMTHLSGTRHRVYRAMAEVLVSPTVISEMLPKQSREAVVLLYGLLDSPNEFSDLIHKYAANTVLSATYGYEIDSLDDPFVLVVQQFHRLYSQIEPTLDIINRLPFLQYYPCWMPFSRYKGAVDQMKSCTRQMRDLPFRIGVTKISEATPLSSLISILLPNGTTDESLEERNIQEELIKDCAGAMYLTGADLTAETLIAFIMAMALHPHVLKKGYEEVTRVVGHRLPTFDDRLDLPYVEAIMLEVLRWNSLTPLGFSHSPSRDDSYRGYIIPKNCCVFANFWAILHNSDIFPRPEEFEPERYLGVSALRAKDAVSIIWGWGRRICPGRQIADGALFISIATIIYTFEIFSYKSEGEPAHPPRIFSTGYLRRPEPFHCTVKPRSSRTRDLIIDAYRLSM